ncbi:MAG TPA: sensor histidine kinase [Candidatus Ruania gallistercoris]|uniref:histidine kinase n=1 Tax=Candidatus Ruania gallistercoris TaxID=2838746 RepID=A0A9D2EEY2_9MICO|nr:sensor histidine kinase [Candidatus Ruania gallistercoris]
MRTDRGWKRFYATGWVVSCLIGIAAIHEWRGRMRAIEQQLFEAQRTRQAVVQRVAAEERLRIARELHDSLTHSISVVKMQSGVAAHLARKRGEPVPEALQAIEQAAGEAARDLRETLGVLRRDSGEATDSRGLRDLPELIERTRDAGLTATLTVLGSPRPLPQEVDAAAYRIVQEALTNVSRHAGTATARVQVSYRADELTVLVEDDGVGHRGAPASTGLGLIGMRERAAALGGRLAAQGRPGGGFTVRADLPAAEDR